MSSKYQLDCDDDIIAKVAMCIFCHTSAPIAIYETESECPSVIDPTEMLAESLEYTKGKSELLKKTMDSIKEYSEITGSTQAEAKNG